MDRGASRPLREIGSPSFHAAPNALAAETATSENRILGVADASTTASLTIGGSRQPVQSGSSLRNLTSRFRRDVVNTNHQYVDPRGPLGLHTLFEPVGSSCIADIIFIHGLNGGSRKTWSISPSEEKFFWPKTWLPEDQDFWEARIHTYGYDSDWGKRTRSILNIHDFAQSLLTVLKNHPLIRRSHTRIILIGHSMGGCVAKKTYVLARENPAYEQLASRFHSIFFLGTPHRGANLAVILRNLLQVAWGTKPYVEDLAPDSQVLTEMNETFRSYSDGIYVFSFFETLPMPGINKLVVDKLSATLGFGNEEICLMDADHRNVCRFRHQSDPNYQKLRNALSSAIDTIKAGTKISNDSRHSVNNHSQLLKVGKYLGAADMDSLDDDLAMFEEFKIPGSCSWFTALPFFLGWTRREPGSPHILWLTGRPGVGKSILCGHVMDQLKGSGIRCSYYIFKHGKAGTRTLASLLSSMAFQMALQDQNIQQCLLRLAEEGVNWEPHDERSIWRKLFLSAILKVDSIATHFWVIDGLDECLKFGHFFKLLSQLPEGLRIFITSRSLPEVDRGIATLGTHVLVHAMTADDTINDMRLYVESKLEDSSHPATKILADRILDKANGSFLWARLVIQDLETSYTEEDVELTLKEVPEDLSAVYGRILHSIESDKRRFKLARSILNWVTLVARPLTVKELQLAVKLDTNEMPQSMEQAIMTSCGQFVFIDPSTRVQLIHETARTFLLSDDLTSGLAVCGSQGHVRLALLCLAYMKDVFKPHQTVKFGKLNKVDTIETALLNYAATNFSEHVFKGTSSDLSILAELRRFLDWTVLFWIEFHAQLHDLSPITQTAMNLAGYLSKVAKYVPPTDSNIQLIESWITDMIRVCARFRKHILTCPSSIYLLIPGYCPMNSAIYRRFSSVSSLIKLKGSREPNWDECLMRVDYQSGISTAIGHGERYFAVGRSNGDISIYDMVSLQTCGTVQHPGRVSCIDFATEDRYFASCGKDYLVIWDPKTSREVHRFPSPQALAFTFTPDLNILLFSKLNRIISIQVSANEIDTVSLAEANAQSALIPSQSPTRAAFSSGDLGMLGLFYRSHPVLVFDYNTGALLGQCSVGWNNGVNAMAFNPNPDIPALVVAYTDGNLVVYDTRTFKSTFMATNICAHALACSADGRSLVTGSNNGVIEIYEFAGAEGNVLELIHRIHTQEPDIRGMAFSSDGLRFVNICPDKCRVWEPAALVRRDAEWLSQSELSADAPLSPRTSIVGMMEVSSKPEITALVCMLEQELVICGKNNGDVSLYSTSDGTELKVLYRHSKGMSIHLIDTTASQTMIATADDCGRVIVAHMTGKLPRWSLISIQLDKRYGSAIHSLILSPLGDYILISGPLHDEIWDIATGTTIGRLDWKDGIYRALLHHPINSQSFVIFHKEQFRCFQWPSFAEDGEMLIPESNIAHESSTGTTSITTIHKMNERWVVEANIARNDHIARRIRYWKSAQSLSTPASFQTSGKELGGAFTSMVRNIIALVDSTLFFLDINQWVCSLNLDTIDTSMLAQRHFFILPEWLDENGRLLCSVTSDFQFVFASKDAIITVEAGLEFVESVAVVKSGSWKVISGSMHRRVLGPTSASSVPRPGAEGRTYSANLRSDLEVDAT